MFARQLAWLQATPKGAKSSRAQQQGIAEDIVDYLPPLGELGFITQHWVDLGLFSSNGMGREPIRYTELQAYAELTKMNFSAWDARMLVALSREYVTFSETATDATTPEPCSRHLHDPDLMARKRAAVASDWALIKKRRNKNGSSIDRVQNRHAPSPKGRKRPR